MNAHCICCGNDNTDEITSETKNLDGLKITQYYCKDRDACWKRTNDGILNRFQRQGIPACFSCNQRPDVLGKIYGEN